MGKLRVLSHSSAAFRDRREAGLLFADELKRFKDKGAVVLGILRGGIIIAREVAWQLGAELDIVLARKIGAPRNEELAVGAVSENGELFVNKVVAAYAGADSAYIQQERKRQMAEIERRSKLFREIQPKVSLKGRVAIITDDGVATGATLQAALWALAGEQPSKIIAAVPVGPEETLKSLIQDADEVLCLKAPHFFNAVGQFYAQFGQISDEDVLAILKEYNKEAREKYESGKA